MRKFSNSESEITLSDFSLLLKQTISQFSENYSEKLSQLLFVYQEETTFFTNTCSSGI